MSGGYKRTIQHESFQFEVTVAEIDRAVGYERRMTNPYTEVIRLRNRIAYMAQQLFEAREELELEKAKHRATRKQAREDTEALHESKKQKK